LPVILSLSLRVEDSALCLRYTPKPDDFKRIDKPAASNPILIGYRGGSPLCYTNAKPKLSRWDSLLTEVIKGRTGSLLLSSNKAMSQATLQLSAEYMIRFSSQFSMLRL